MDVPETNLTRPLISRRLITLLWESEEQAGRLRDFDLIRTRRMRGKIKKTEVEEQALG